jgi:L,D-transpeptidase YcbB
MKQVTFAAVICLLVTTSCNNVAGWFGSNADSTSKADSSSMVLLRDETINASNAYSDLFLDSAALDNYIKNEKLDDSIALHLRNFYLVRNYQFAWFTTQGLTEQGKGLWSMRTSDSTELDKPVAKRMDSLMMNDSLIVQANDSSYLNTEIGLTREFIELAKRNQGLISTSNFYYLVPAKKMDPVQLADSIQNKNVDSARYAGNKAYVAMKQHLALYVEAEKKGGWQPLSALTGNLKQGSSSPSIIAIKKRMAATNDYNNADTTAVYSDSLTTAIKSFQQRNGLSPTGKINDSLITVLNVPAKERMAQLIMNMNRMMWMKSMDDSNRIVVNIPGFMLYAFEGNNRVLEMPVIVGKEGAGTVMFSDAINEVVFNPSWNLPRSIVENEVMPAMKKDKDYLKKKNMEIVNKNDSIPEIRQLPGRENALGRVKFLFPNSYDIYLHDTPDKTLFNKKNRAISHGCIRVENPIGLAQFILKNQSEWTTEKIRSAMNSNTEQHVKVSREVPVYITYYTAWVDENGLMNFRNDVYGNDAKTALRMFL